MRIYFTENQYILLEIETAKEFDEHYNTDSSLDPVTAWTVAITRQSNLQRGCFGIVVVRDNDVDGNFRHETVHIANAIVRVHGYMDTEEEAVATWQDVLIDAFEREYYE